jgi:hypothetical protein
VEVAVNQFKRYLLLPVILSLLLSSLIVACSQPESVPAPPAPEPIQPVPAPAPSTETSPPSQSTPAPELPPVSRPDIKILAPFSDVTISANDITISVRVTNFNLVDKKDQANEKTEGHIHYFMDVDVPTTPGKPAFTAEGTYANATATSYTWSNVKPGEHVFSVELVNNDHTPLNPPRISEVRVITKDALPATLP